MDNTAMLYITGILAFLFVTLFVILLVRSRKKQAKAIKKLNIIAAKKNTKNNLYYLYRFYMATPLLRRYYLKLKNSYRVILPADEITLDRRTTSRMTQALAICLAIIIGVILLAKGDVPYIMVGILACYIVFTNMINNSEQKLQIKILDQLDTCISDVHAYYQDSHMVDEALNATLDDLPYEIGLHANRIYDIITSTDIDAEVNVYQEVAPNKFLLLFCTICATIQEHGDKVLESGRTMFLKNLNFLKDELGIERLRLKKRVLAFSGKTFSVLIPLFCLKPIELWAENAMPEVASYYQGAGGVISLTIVMLITLLCYEFINVLKDDHKEEGRSFKLYKRIAAIPFVKHYITAWINHNYTKGRRITDKLKSVGETITIDLFIVKKFVTAIVLFLVVNVVAIYAVESEKSMILHDFSEAYSSSAVPDEEYRENMKKLSEMYAKDIRRGTSEEEIRKKIQKKDPSLDNAYVSMISKELANRAELYSTKYYKIYMLLIALLAGVIGFQIPEWVVKYKQKIMGMAREDEVSQFRTLILILMHEDGMTLMQVLEWMERFAHAFKSSITDCILNLERDEDRALMDMRDAESGFAPFRRLCDSLIAVDKVGLASAFDDLETDREYYKEERRKDNEHILKKCVSRATLLQFIPVWVVILIYLILPIAQYAMTMFNELDLTTGL